VAIADENTDECGEVSGPVEICWVDAQGQPHRAAAEAAAGVAFEHGGPVRRFRWDRGQRHFPGLWWAATTGRHVGFESWLERDHAMLLDFDPDVVGLASQPFTLGWSGQKTVAHTPDYFARRADGSAVVVDVRPRDRVPAKDAAKFKATAAFCAGVPGWSFRLVHEVEAPLASNVRWLSGYRHPRYGRSRLSPAMAEIFAGGARLLDGAEAAGDPLESLPVVFHLLWTGALHADVSVPLADDTLVLAAGGLR
jgi:hypothetical protein